MRRIKPVHLLAHPNLYAKMEEIGKMYKENSGVELTQMQITNLISKRIRFPKIPNLNLIGDEYAKKKGRHY